MRENCIFGAAEKTVSYEDGFVAANLGNRQLNPHYRNSAAGDYTIPASSPCAAYLMPGVPLLPF